ncbi:hypothetical protein PsYK624_082780 [Phanerochaete sordida]|uniref:Uncharacterized protein n=1 Tax=Phanerochaete sordida TaxID=48140 RepID=A0A9P3LED2_9APHY|nr:hypothetical protein PsYK624_082780 [Phanerochaete sordida]
MAPTQTKASTKTKAKSKTKRTFATPNGGRWIFKTRAMKEYKLTSKDLEAIRPIAMRANPYNYTHPMVQYNECDVAALAYRKHHGGDAPVASTSAAPPAPIVPALAEVNGPGIMHSKAKERYSLKNWHLAEINPISIIPNPHGGPYPMKHYNLCDVEALAERHGLAPKLPSTPRKRRSRATPTSSATVSPSSSPDQASAKSKGKAKEVPPEAEVIDVDEYEDDGGLSDEEECIVVGIHFVRDDIIDISD